MQINGLTNSVTWQPSVTNKNISTTNETNSPKSSEQGSLVRELANGFDPKDMSRNESMALANQLMRAGEGHLSSVFLPLPPLQRESDGSITDLTGTPQGDAIMNQKSNIIEQVTQQIEYKKILHQPTQHHENALDFLNQLQVAKTSTPIDVYAWSG